MKADNTTASKVMKLAHKIAKATKSIEFIPKPYKVHFAQALKEAWKAKGCEATHKGFNASVPTFAERIAAEKAELAAQKAARLAQQYTMQCAVDVLAEDEQMTTKQMYYILKLGVNKVSEYQRQRLTKRQASALIDYSQMRKKVTIN